MTKIKIRLPNHRQLNDRGLASEAPLENGIFFLNTTGEEIPAYGVFQGHDTRNEQYMPAIVIAKKPIDATANASAIFVNGPHAVPNNSLGFAQDGPLYQVLTDGTATAGEGLGLTDDSFEASPGSGPFIAIGEDDVRDDIYLCILQAGGTVKHVYPPNGGIPAATWDSGTEKMTPGKAACRIARKVAGVYEPTDETQDVENPVGVPVGASGKPLTVGQNTSGAWTVLVEDCTSSSSGPVASNTQAGKLNLNYKLGVGLGV